MNKMGLLVPVYFIRTVTDKSGSELRKEEIAFNMFMRQIRVVRQYHDPTGEDDSGLTDNIDITNKDVPLDTYVNEMLELGLRGLPFKNPFKDSINIISRMGKIWAFEIEITEMSKISVPAGDFNCFIF